MSELPRRPGIAEPALGRPGGVAVGRAARARRSVPYLLLAPAVARDRGGARPIRSTCSSPLSFQQYGLFELIRHEGAWVGLDNYSTILRDRQFWDVLVRTVVFTAACVR